MTTKYAASTSNHQLMDFQAAVWMLWSL